MMSTGAAIALCIGIAIAWVTFEEVMKALACRRAARESHARRRCQRKDAP